MNTKDIVGWIIGVILIILALYVVFYVWNPSTDAKADAAAAIVGGGYLLRKYMKNKKSHKKRK